MGLWITGHKQGITLLFCGEKCGGERLISG
jgi:hypothetical protein